MRNRRDQRRHRLRQYPDRCREALADLPPPGNLSALRRGGPFAYRCDHCHRPVLRPARELFVFCSKCCREAYRRGRRRLLRRFPSLPRFSKHAPERFFRPPVVVGLRSPVLRP